MLILNTDIIAGLLKWPRGEIIRPDNVIDPNSSGNLKMLDGRLAFTPIILILYT